MRAEARDVTAACGLLDAELALDRLEAETTAELPAYMRAFAHATIHGSELPPAPPVLRRASTLRIVQDARAHPVLADRALAIARIVVPPRIEDDPRVVAARELAPLQTTWDAWARLADVRDEVAREKLGDGFIAVMHRLYGVTHAPREVAWPAEVAEWFATDGIVIDTAAVEARWRGLAERHGARGTVTFVADTYARRARTFVVEPQREVIVLVPSELAMPATRFLTLHEFGHALVALLAPAGVPRVVDEAAAAFIARAIEDPLDAWHSPRARLARERRVQMALALDAIEQRASNARPTALPMWALWHDPGAQAAYAAAEAIADAWAESRDGTLASKIAAERAPIDAAP